MNIIRRLRTMRRHSACEGEIERLISKHVLAYECERRLVRSPTEQLTSKPEAPVLMSAWGVNRKLEVARG
jgi:hypothetical protein